ncbi:MAG: ATP-binding cassette domain-containing protein [Opitutaceae bacterium]
MNLEISQLRLPLASFVLEFNATLHAPVTGLFGPSGAGKTSLLETIAGLRRPTDGLISLDGVLLTDGAARIFRRPETRGIGYVPQDGALFTHLTVRENLTYSQRTQAHVAPPGLTYAHVVEVLNIGALDRRRIGSLSGGEKQRVAFGRALLAAPQLLLLDEPLASLDTELKDQILPYLLKIRDEFKIPMLLVSHSADEIVALCDEVFVLETGRCVRRGPASALFTVSPQPHHVLAKMSDPRPVSPTSD